jgi:hypothetical protein
MVENKCLALEFVLGTGWAPPQTLAGTWQVPGRSSVRVGGCWPTRNPCNPRLLSPRHSYPLVPCVMASVEHFALLPLKFHAVFRRLLTTLFFIFLAPVECTYGWPKARAYPWFNNYMKGFCSVKQQSASVRGMGGATVMTVACPARYLTGTWQVPARYS